MSETNSRSFQRTLCWIITAFAASSAVWVDAQEQEVLIGRTAAGQLKVDINFVQPLQLVASVYPGISGYATGALGFHSTQFDDPTNDLFQLSTSADFRFILLAKDAGMEVWNDTGSGYMGIGESFYIGPAPFDTHPVWNLVAGTPCNVFSLTLRLHDLNGVYPDSAPFVLSFTAALVPPINIRLTDPTHVTLSWPTNAFCWTLESTALLSATNWNTVTNAPGFAGADYSLGMSVADTPQQFFRLHKQ